MKEKKYDLITLGRSSIDLYSQSIGAEFVDITGFNAFVGGSPLNIAVGVRRLGAQTALLTGIGNDKVGDFVLNFLEKEKVHIQPVVRVKGARTSAVVLGIQPPDKFPLVYYRDNAADSRITIDDVIAARVHEYSVLEISATALNIEPSRSAVFYAVEQAFENKTDIVLDIDFRSDQWDDVRSFGLMVRAILPKVKIAIGTEEEILATTLSTEDQLKIVDQQISAPEIKGDLESAISKIISSGPEMLIVKRGAKGCSVFHKDGRVEDVKGYPVEVINVLGAGDAFASGFIFGYLNGWDVYKSCRLGNACGAWVVQKPGCANDMPYYDELMEFVTAKGGLI